MKTDFRASVPSPPLRGALMLSLLIHPRQEEELLALVLPWPGHLSQLSQTRLGQAGAGSLTSQDSLGSGRCPEPGESSVREHTRVFSLPEASPTGPFCSHAVWSPIPALMDCPLQLP